MFSKKLLLVLMCSSFAILLPAWQGPGEPLDITDLPGTGCCDMNAGGVNTAQLLAHPGNYKAMLPAGNLQITNRGYIRTHVLVIGENTETGVKMIGMVSLDVGQSYRLKAGQLGDAQDVYLISLQGFTAESDAMDKRDNVTEVVSPSANNLLLIQVNNKDGELITAGVDEKGRVHYPVHGAVLGKYEPQTRVVIRPDDSVLQIH